MTSDAGCPVCQTSTNGWCVVCSTCDNCCGHIRAGVVRVSGLEVHIHVGYNDKPLDK